DELVPFDVEHRPSSQQPGEPAAALALPWPGVAGPVWRARKRIGSAPAAFRPCRRPAVSARRIAAAVPAVPRAGPAAASAGPLPLAPLRARPAHGVSVGEQQSHYCDTEQHKADRAHGSSPSPDKPWGDEPPIA